MCAASARLCKLLYGATKPGLTVVITDDALVPEVAPADMLAEVPEDGYPGEYVVDVAADIARARYTRASRTSISIVVESDVAVVVPSPALSLPYQNF